MSFLRRFFAKQPAPPSSTVAPVLEEPMAATSPVAAPEPSEPQPVQTEIAVTAQHTPSLARVKTISRPLPKADRVKTRLFSHGKLDAVLDEIEQAQTRANAAISHPVGWLVIIEGPGTGGWFTLDTGVTRIGRGEDQDLRLNFGDDTITRTNHASIAYEQGDHRFRLGAGECRNALLVNGEVVEGTINLSHGDRITIGETTLRLAAFCDDRFSWAPIIDKGDQNVLSA